MNTNQPVCTRGQDPMYMYISPIDHNHHHQRQSSRSSSPASSNGGRTLRSKSITLKIDNEGQGPSRSWSQRWPPSTPCPAPSPQSSKPRSTETCEPSIKEATNKRSN
ncbi:hypothetical protein LOK49_LG05G02010 [Camellia lanceoleosa]|uniref:Uncharacterized protein n=1 Tax=Camellia lanceoleosa TaxID=1840588 RepID=A0ACC0HT48_9ERIC|nr:hypothetical protein LOK49_LG05G02010 [Camellia lanceoleosa]